MLQVARLQALLGDNGATATGATARVGGSDAEAEGLRRQLKETRAMARDAREALRQWREETGMEHLKAVVCKYIELDEEQVSTRDTPHYAHPLQS